MNERFDQFLPRSPAALHILLAHASEDRHGYGIMREIARQSGGRYKLGPGTLYDNLQKLLDQGIVEERSPRFAGDDPRRRYYRLSRFGRGLLATEIARLEGVVREAKVHLNIRPEAIMTRTLYRWLVCLHPPAFRLRFEEELLWIFDESSDVSGGAPLLYDAAISLLRQWILRSGMWKWVVGGIGGMVYLLIGFGSFLFNWPIRCP